ncbi:MAG: type I glutamate--ammonia ligase [Bdellovibrionales bacterium]|nr:type I glutamate--ammonia ligase [Bdellovibrionales bacterium]
MNAQEAIDYAHKYGAKMVDLKFTDLLGTWQHLTIPISQLKPDVFTEGLGFDGSSIRGWRNINESDMIIMPDSKTVKMDPFTEIPTVSFICDVTLPESGAPYDRDPRQIAKKALAYLNSTGIADTAFFGPEAEFFIFDDIRYQQDSNLGFYQVDSMEGQWNSGRDEGSNLGYKPRHKEGYFPAMPTDTLHDIRTEICLRLEDAGIPVERHHHEVASAGQGEINFKFNEIIESADDVQWFKYIVKNTARRHGKTATFMPKPIFEDNGSGMHVHMSLWKDGKPLFSGNQYAGLSETALHFIGGILKHAPALCAFTNPTTNSYKRLVPGFEAPVKLAYSFKNRSAAIRIPNSGDNPKAKRIEFRTPDATANPYIAFAALLMAGIDGVQNKIHPGEPLDKNIYGLPPEEAAKVPSVPSSLNSALVNLERDGDFLLKGEVFNSDFIKNWVDYKLEREILPMQQRPVPYEFFLYYDM